MTTKSAPQATDNLTFADVEFASQYDWRRLMDSKRSDLPAFEVLMPDGHRFKVWADGHIEGYPLGAIVINRIPQYATDMAARVLKEHVDHA